MPADRFVDLEDAESIVQDLMTWLWENKELVLIESSLGNYLFRPTYNRTLNLKYLPLILILLRGALHFQRIRVGPLGDYPLQILERPLRPFELNRSNGWI